MRTVTAGELIKKIRRLTDQENSAFISDEELLEYVDSAFAEFYDLLVSTYEQYNMTFATLITEEDVQIYNLPANFYKLMGVEVKLSSGRKASLQRVEWSERNNIDADTATVSAYATNLQYNIIGNTLMLNPSPTAGLEVTLWYVPAAPKIIETTQIIDGINGWEQLIVLECAIRVMDKQEADSTPFVKQKDKLLKRIEQASESRDLGSPQRVSDTRGLESPTFTFTRRY